MKIDDIRNKLELHSDRVRAALNAIPGEILVGLPDHQILELVRHIDALACRSYQQGVKDKDAAFERERADLETQLAMANQIKGPAGGQ